MKKLFIASLLSLTLSFGVAHADSGASASSNSKSGDRPDIPAVAELHMPVCAPGGKAEVRCHARVVVAKNGKPRTSPSAVGLGPNDFHTAYTSQTTAAGQPIIAIVDAYDQPNILADLNNYSSYFKIPTMPACSGPIASSAVPCFQKIDQFGGTNYPAVNPGWALEISLDVEAAHAMCQNCRILLVEAASNSYSDLMAAIDQAVASGAKIVSNSYGSIEFNGEDTFDSHFNVGGVAMTFSTGDAGYGAQFPAASPFVTAVGGTSLNFTQNGSYKNETAWSGAGSGCSAFEPKPIWQKDSGCANRTVADVSAVADPNTGAAVYDSVVNQGQSGWVKVGGTSLASPLIAGMYALAGALPTGTSAGSLLYTAGTSSFHDILSGSNGSCGGTYLCTAMTGYDGPTGRGTPNGLAAF
jgi:subtilase family serine protease